MGGMETALMLWEVCCVPSLLHGAGTWTEISSKTEKTTKLVPKLVFTFNSSGGTWYPLAFTFVGYINFRYGSQS